MTRSLAPGWCGPTIRRKKSRIRPDFSGPPIGTRMQTQASLRMRCPSCRRRGWFALPEQYARCWLARTRFAGFPRPSVIATRPASPIQSGITASTPTGLTVRSCGSGRRRRVMERGSTRRFAVTPRCSAVSAGTSSASDRDGLPSDDNWTDQTSMSMRWWPRLPIAAAAACQMTDSTSTPARFGVTSRSRCLSTRAHRPMGGLRATAGSSMWKRRRCSS